MTTDEREILLLVLALQNKKKNLSYRWDSSRYGNVSDIAVDRLTL